MEAATVGGREAKRRCRVASAAHVRAGLCHRLYRLYRLRTERVEAAACVRGRAGEAAHAAFRLESRSERARLVHTAVVRSVMVARAVSSPAKGKGGVPTRRGERCATSCPAQRV